jgi:1,4-alpha-glucan branching enzyme
MKRSTALEINRRKSKIGPIRKRPSRNLSKSKSALPARITDNISKTLALLSEHGTPRDIVTIHLKLYRPDANEVFVAGSFNDWQPRGIPLHLFSEGEWEVDLMLKPGIYEYRFVVDGQWTDDPLAARFAANPFGGLNSVLDVPI